MELNKKPTYQDLEKQINELKSKNRLKHSEDRFNKRLKASEDMITIHKPNGKYLYYNGPECYAITPEDIVGKMPNDLFNKDVSNILTDTFKKVEKTGESETLEVLLDWQGEKRWFSEHIYPIKDDDGKVVELVKVCRDIHQLKLTEQEIENKNKALLQSYKAHRDVLEASSDLISVVDENGKILFINHASKKFYGLSPKKCLGKSIFDFTHPEDREYTKTKLLEWGNSKNNHFQFENRQISSLGEILETEWSINIERKETKVIKTTSIIRDITKQNITHRELISAIKEREQFFNFFNLSPDIMVITSLDGVFQSVNPATTKLLGYSEEILTSKPFLDFVHPDDRQSSLNEFAIPLKEGFKVSINYENRYLCKNNECIYLSWNAFFNKKEGLIYATARDITKEKLIEIELIKSKEHAEENEEKKISALLKLENSEKRLKQTQKLAKVGSWFIDL
ncbi:MAG: PAS domain S-box-containing protein, partial [Psychroserpens sp.]